MKYKHLIREQRYAIFLGLQEGKSQKAIAQQINVHPSTVSREIKRNLTHSGKYSWRKAHENACIRKERVPGNRSMDRSILKEALQLLKTEDWSPKQISGYLALSSKRICHETIYKRIRADESGELRRHCRHKMKHRHRMKAAGKNRSSIPDRISIHDRPEEANGKRFGDWEMDTIVDSCGRAILTLTERSTNFILMEKLPQGRKALPTAQAVVRLLFPYRQFVKTITTDNGLEFAAHKEITRQLSIKGMQPIKVYFTDAYSSWQKGAIENANKLIRQYIPKKTDFKKLTDQFIKEVQYKINRRPREKLHFSTPKKEFFNLIL